LIGFPGWKKDKKEYASKIPVPVFAGTYFLFL